MLRIFRHYVSGSAVALLLLELTILTLVLYYCAMRFAGAEFELAGPSFALLACLLLAVLISAVLWSMGIYDRWHLADYKRLAKRLGIGFVACYPLLQMFRVFESSFAGLVPATFNPIFYAGTMAAAFGGIFVSRLAFTRLSHVADLQRTVLVVGVGPRAARIESFVRQRGNRLRIAGFLRAPNEASEVSHSKIVAEEGSLRETARRLGAEEIVVAVTDRRGVPVQPLLDCRLDGLTVTDYLTFWEREANKLMLDALDPSWMIYSDGFKIGRVVNATMKRGLDLVVSAVFLLFLLPLMAFVALAIKLDSPGPVFYTQERVGRNGRSFVLYKFRSMRIDAEASGIPQWASARDPRITRLGAMLRKMRIDEIPQVINVLKGDMSFIGPRPERAFFVASLNRDIPYYNERHRLRPGITGWAQVKYPYGASIEDAREKLAYDLYYIKNYSLMLDLLTLFATVQVVFWPQGVR